MLKDLFHAKTLLDLGFQIQVTREEKAELYKKYSELTYDDYFIIEVSKEQVFIKRK